MNVTARTTGLESLLTPDNCVLLLIDHQPFQVGSVQSHDRQLVINNVTGLAKTAKAFNIPTILTTVVAERGGKLLKDIQDVFPEQQPIDRTNLNTWEDEKVVNLVKATGRKKIIIAALYTEICLAYPVMTALGEGYEVYIVTDASGGVSMEAHEMAILRMVSAGAVPMTWIAVLGELQRDYAREETLPAITEIFKQHGGAIGINLFWESQLLGENTSTKAPAIV